MQGRIIGAPVVRQAMKDPVHVAGTEKQVQTGYGTNGQRTGRPTQAGDGRASKRHHHRCRYQPQAELPLATELRKKNRAGILTSV